MESDRFFSGFRIDGRMFFWYTEFRIFHRFSIARGDTMKSFSEYFRKRKLYFQEASQSIAEDNLRTLFWSSWALVLLLLCFLFLTPFIIESWEASAYHICFLPAALFLLAVMTAAYRKKISNSRAVFFLCLLFDTLIYCFVVLIDTAGAVGAPASFIPVIYIALPAIFTLPFYITYGLLGFFELIYIFAVLACKPQETGQYDIFNSLVGLGCSFAIYYLILSLRIHDYEMQLKYKDMSMRDSLSSTFNKQASVSAARQYLDSCGSSVTCAFLVLDLDDFKNVNDTKGHFAGDMVLKATGKALLELFRHTDVVGRFGGDEFLVLVKGTASQDLMDKKCRAIQASLQKASQEEIGMKVSCSMGVVLAQRQDVDYDALFQEADLALYEAKRAGKSQYCIRRYAR